IPVPHVSPTQANESRSKNMLSEALYGFRYIFTRPGLLGLLFIYFAFNLSESLGYPLIAPMLLSRSQNNEALLGGIQGVMGPGGVLGGLFLTLWGGPKRKIHGLLIGVILTGLLGDALMGLGQAVPTWIVAGFCVEFFIPMMLGSGTAIWQIKVAPEVQGRVFA